MCTLEKRGRVYLLTLTGDGEHRLNPTLLGSIRSALAHVRSAADAGPAALVTAAEGKFFSNGFDLDWARVSPHDRPMLMSQHLQLVIADLISLPMPTIAAVTGHAAAGGCALVLSHNYAVMRSDRGFFYMSELDIGVPISGYFAALLRRKIPDPRALRDVVLRAKRVAAAEAVAMGVVDQAAERAVEAAVGMGEELAARGWEGRVYASIRRELFPEVCRAVGLPDQEEEDIRKMFVSKL